MSSYAAYLLLYLGALCCASLIATDLQAAGHEPARSPLAHYPAGMLR
ncbi:hypothetical protein [Pseudomonas sp. LRF_L74]